MKKEIIGIFGGRFTPLHNGHVGAILRAAEHVDNLYVILSYAESDPIEGKMRLKWMNAVFSVYGNINIVDVERDKILETVGEWLDDSYNIRQKISILRTGANNPNEVKIDKVFVGSNDHDDMFKICYPEAEVVVLDPLRSDITISGTEIRGNIYKYWEYLPKFVRKDYARPIVVANEKLRNQLTDRFSTVKVEDVYAMYVRIYGQEVVDNDYDVRNMIYSKLRVLCDEAAYNANRVYFTPVEKRCHKPVVIIKDNVSLDDAIEVVKKLIS